MTSTESAELKQLKQLKRQNAELRRASEVLRTASAFFAAELDRPHEMIRYVDMYRGRFGVEAICRTLGATECGFITARGYRAAKPGRHPRGGSQIRSSVPNWPGCMRRTTACTGCGKCMR